jgi:5-methylcytosine-specific restriction endonuclease McrA
MGGSDLQPWQAYPDIWKTPAAFWAWVRGGIRGAVWKRYPPKLEWKKNQMVPPPAGYTGRAKSMGKCHYCSQLFAASHLEVDHVKQAGSCNSWETANQFLQNLLDTNGNWVLACKPCHKVKSFAERTGASFEDALCEKLAIDFMKRKSKAEVLAHCEKFGYNPNALSNDKKRRTALVAIFTKERNEKESST